jgi:hypothetical protein
LCEARILSSKRSNRPCCNASSFLTGYVALTRDSVSLTKLLLNAEGVSFTFIEISPRNPYSPFRTLYTPTYVIRDQHGNPSWCGLVWKPAVLLIIILYFGRPIAKLQRGALSSKVTLRKNIYDCFLHSSSKRKRQISTRYSYNGRGVSWPLTVI